MGFFSDFRYRKISHTSTVNDLLKETFRKSIHICASIVPFMAATHFSFTVSALAFVVCFYIWCEYRRLGGHAVPFISRITAYAARSRDEGQFVLGPVTMAIGILLTLLVFPSEMARIGILALAFGDGIASLAGKVYGKFKVPHTQGKTVEGSSACFIAVYISTLILTCNPVHALAIAIFAAIIEILPLKDYDNLFIPILIAALAYLLP